MTRFTSFVTLLFLTLSWVPGCATRAPEKSQLEIREMQTRTFRTTENKRVMQAVTDALLDDGYIIKQTNNELGLINAQKKQTRSGIPRDTQQTYALTAQVRTLKNRTRVRLNMQKTTMSTGQHSFFDEDALRTRTYREKHSSRVTNPNVYQRLFSKIDKSLFIEQEVYEDEQQKTQENGNAPSNDEQNASGEDATEKNSDEESE